MPLNKEAIIKDYIFNFLSEKEQPRVNVKANEEVFSVSAMDFYAAYNTCILQMKTGGRCAAAYLRAGKSKALPNADYVDLDEWPEYAMRNEASIEAPKELATSDERPALLCN